LRPGIVPPGLLLFWPYVLAAIGVLLWLLILRKRVASRLEYAIVAFVACTVANIAVDEVCSYLVPLDIAGTVPPDPRNALLRALITLAAQVPATLALGYSLARRPKLKP
jgi:hypothetical protein